MEVVMEENKMHTGELYRSNDEQKQIIKLTKQDLFKNAFLGSFITNEKIHDASKQLNLTLPESYVWFLTHYGSGGFFFETLGFDRHFKAEFVEETLKQRKLGLPQQCIVIENCDEFYYCLDSKTQKVVSWSAYDQEGLIDRYDDFEDYLLDRIKNAIDNN